MPLQSAAGDDARHVLKFPTASHIGDDVVPVILAHVQKTAPSQAPINYRDLFHDGR